MPSRTQIVCLHEGEKGRSIDPVFIRTLLKALDPAWLRPWKGSNVIRTVDCNGRNTLMAKMPQELRNCGSSATLMVWADLDDDMANPAALKQEFWKVAEQAGITKGQFDQVVFMFAKDRIENWIQYLTTGQTDESQEGPRVDHTGEAAAAAKLLAKRCLEGTSEPKLPPSMAWSCQNWRTLVHRMKR